MRPWQRDSCLRHIFSSGPSGWFWLCNYSSPRSLQTWPCAPQAQGSGICSTQWYFLLALESPWSTCPELGTTEVPSTLPAAGPCSLGPGRGPLTWRFGPGQSAHDPHSALPSPPASAVWLRLSPRPDAPSSANSSSLPGSDQVPAPFPMTSPFSELLQRLICPSGWHRSLSKTHIDL